MITNVHMLLKQLDRPGSVFLLEGKREVKQEDEWHLYNLGAQLCSNSEHIIFRSGNAPGSDHLFSKGVASVDASRMQVIVPYRGHRRDNYVGGRIFGLDCIDLRREKAVVKESQNNRGTKRIINQYVAGVVNATTISAAYILRDSVKVIGASGITPATAAFFYESLSKPLTGGTGFTISVCRRHNVPHCDQRTWLPWLKDTKGVN